MSTSKKRNLKRRIVGCFCISAIAANMAPPVIPVISDMGVITAEATFQPAGTITQHTVTFNTNGGSNVTMQLVQSGQTVTLPTPPTRENCTFDGWYTDANLTNEYDFNKEVTDNITLYAKWIVNIDLNDLLATAGTNSSYDSTGVTVEYGYYGGNGSVYFIRLKESFYKISGSNLVNDAYVDVQIETNSSVPNTYIEFDNASIINSGYFLFSDDVRSVTPFLTYSGTTLTISGKLNIDTLSIYNGTGYNITNLDDGFGTLVIDSFTVKFVDEDGTLIDENYYLKGSEYPVTPGKYTDYELNLYSISEEFPCTQLPSSVSEDTTITVRNHKDDDLNGSCDTCGTTINYTVTFNTNGGEAIAEQEVVSGNTINQPITPTRENCTFDGWYTDANLTNEYDFNKEVTDNITLYAKWIVNINLNDLLAAAGTNSRYDSTGVTVEYGYYGDDDNSYTITLKESFYKISGSNLVNDAYVDVQIRTNYSVPNTYIEFDNASIINSGYFLFSDKIRNVTPFLTYSGTTLTISGKLNIDTLSIYNGTGYNITYLGGGSGTLVIDSFTVKFDDEDGVTVDENYYLNGYNYDVTTTGYIDTDMNEYSISEEFPCMKVPETVSDNTTVKVSKTHSDPDNNGNCTACEKHIAEKVTFVTNGGSDIDPVVVLTGETVEKPADPTKEKSFFGGWYTDVECTSAYDFTAPVDKDITLYAKWTALAVDSIAVTKAPTKTTYTVGEELDLTGGKITVTYADNTTDTVDMTAEGVTVDGYDSTKAGTQTITVTYDGKTATFDVTVEEIKVTISSITVSKNPTKVTYTVGDKLDLTGGEITAAYSDDSTKVVNMTDAGVTVTGYDSTKAGTQTITVEYEGKTATFDVTVEEVKVTISSIAVTKNPTKVTYTVGEDLELAGGEITVTYSDGSDAKVAMTDKGVTVTGYDSTKAGTQTITVTYDGKTATFDVTVEEADKRIAYVTRLYTKLLGRNPDAKGLNAHVTALKNGKSATDVAKSFVLCTELAGKKLTNKEFVRRMYVTMLDRNPDAKGLNRWAAALDNGCSYGYVLAGFSKSAEFTKLCKSYGINRGTYTVTENRDKNEKLTAYVARMYTKALNRKYDIKGLNNHTGRYLAGTKDAKGIAHDFIFSKEFINRKLTDDQFIDTMYATFFNRKPDAKGKANWQTRMKNGWTREQVFNGFTGSAEFKRLVDSFGI